MSLEQALAANTAALEALTAQLAGARVSAPAAEPEKQSAPAATGKAGGTKGTPTRTGPSADPKPAKGKADTEEEGATDAPAGVTAAELTAAIVKAVAATNRDAVVGLLQEQFGVKAGKEVTDPAKRAEVIAALDELVTNESVG